MTPALVVTVVAIHAAGTGSTGDGKAARLENVQEALA